MILYKEFSGRLSQDALEILNGIYSLPNKQLGRLLKDNGYEGSAHMAQVSGVAFPERSK